MMIFRIFLALSVGFAACEILAAEDFKPLFDGPPPSRQAVDRSGAKAVPVFTAPGHCAWPNLKVLPNGKTLVAFIFNNGSHGHRPGDVESWISHDGGETWQFGSAVTQHEPDTIRMNHGAGVAANGDLIVLTSGWSGRWPPGEKQTRGKFRFDVLGPWTSRSPDGGLSWLVDKDAFPQRAPTGQPAVPFGDLQIFSPGEIAFRTSGKKESKRRSVLTMVRPGVNPFASPIGTGSMADTHPRSNGKMGRL